MHSGHWPMRSGREVISFLDDSRGFVEAVDAVLRARLAEPATLAELCQQVQLEAGPWDSEPAMLRFAVAGHVRRLVQGGDVIAVEAGIRPPSYRLPPNAEAPDRAARVEAKGWPG
jgi:hypothetical protein